MAANRTPVAGLLAAKGEPGSPVRIELADDGQQGARGGWLEVRRYGAGSPPAVRSAKISTWPAWGVQTPARSSFVRRHGAIVGQRRARMAHLWAVGDVDRQKMNARPHTRCLCVWLVACEEQSLVTQTSLIDDAPAPAATFTHPENQLEWASSESDASAGHQLKGSEPGLVRSYFQSENTPRHLDEARQDGLIETCVSARTAAKCRVTHIYGLPRRRLDPEIRQRRGPGQGVARTRQRSSTPIPPSRGTGGGGLPKHGPAAQL